MKVFEISSSLSKNATIMLLSFLDEVCVGMRLFVQDKTLSPDSKEAVDNCWIALKYLVLHASVQVKIDRGISPNFYDEKAEGLDLLDNTQRALFWSFMFRGTEYMLQTIKSPQYVSNPDYVEVKKQLLEWNKLAQQQYQPFRDVLKSLRKVDIKIHSYNEPGSFVSNLSEA